MREEKIVVVVVVFFVVVVIVVVVVVLFVVDVAAGCIIACDKKKDSTTRIRTVTRVYAQRFFLQNCRNALLVQMTDTCHAADVDETGSSCSGIQSSQLTHVGGPRATSFFVNK